MYVYKMITIILYNIIEVMLLELEWNQQRVTAEIMKYKELLDEGIITKEEFSIKEKELLRKIIEKLLIFLGLP